MEFSKINRTLFVYLGVVFIGLVVTAWLIISAIYTTHTYTNSTNIEQQAHILSVGLSNRFDPEHPAAFQSSIRRFVPDSNVRVVITDQHGIVLADTRDTTSLGDNYRDRPEIRRALAGAGEHGTRHSYTQNMQVLYGAAPLQWGNSVHGAVRLSLPVQTVNRQLHPLVLEFILLSLILFVILAGLGVWMARRFSASLGEIADAVERYGAGDTTARISVNAPGEIGEFGILLNSLFDQFDTRISELQEQHQELESILSNMTEALVLLDADKNVIRFNRSAEQLFRIVRRRALGRKMMEIVRHTGLLEFVDQMYQSDESSHIEIVLYRDEVKMNVAVHGTPVRSNLGELSGVLLVFHDLTHIRKLESIRQDFMANVSHELKTPITSIKGALETLEGGATTDQRAADEFLSMIQRHITRLEKIIDNLLRLSRLEQPDEQNQLPRDNYNVSSILHSAVQLCRSSAREKQIDVDIDCPEQLIWNMNVALLEEAIVNLVENAIKYSEPNQDIEISADVTEDLLNIKVKDYGSGIPEKDLPRIFERFYRVDKSRSREMGGTGLGLAIVKHIAKAHNGSVEAESKVGQGSTFTIHIPSA